MGLFGRKPKKPRRIPPKPQRTAERITRQKEIGARYLAKAFGAKLVAQAERLHGTEMHFFVETLPNGTKSILIQTPKFNFDFTPRGNQIIATKIKFPSELDASIRGIVQAKHLVEQTDRSELARQLQEKIKHAKPEITKKNYPFKQEEKGNILKAMGFAISEALREIEEGTKKK